MARGRGGLPAAFSGAALAGRRAEQRRRRMGSEGEARPAHNMRVPVTRPSAATPNWRNNLRDSVDGAAVLSGPGRGHGRTRQFGTQSTLGEMPQG